MVCHKDHELLLRYSRFYCDCGEGSFNTPCKLTKLVHEKRPAKVDIKTVGYCEYYLKNGQNVSDVASIMKKNNQKYFLFSNSGGRSRDQNVCFIPWIEKKTSQQTCDDITEISDCWAKSCEIDPTGSGATAWVWSEELQKYVDCGLYELY